MPELFNKPPCCPNGCDKSQDPQVYPGLKGHVRYEEGVFVGYRHNDQHGIEPSFAFGHGLGYTSFDLRDVSASAPDASRSVTVRAILANTGARPGSSVVQVYVCPPATAVPRPVKELKGFAKVTLAAGETREITVQLDARAFAYFDGKAGQWRMDAGAFTIAAGFSARDLRGNATVQQTARLLPV